MGNWVKTVLGALCPKLCARAGRRETPGCEFVCGGAFPNRARRWRMVMGGCQPGCHREMKISKPAYL